MIGICKLGKSYKNKSKNQKIYIYRKKSKETRQRNNEKMKKWNKEIKKSSNKKWKKNHVELCQKFGAMSSKLPLAQGKEGIPL